MLGACWREPAAPRPAVQVVRPAPPDAAPRLPDPAADLSDALIASPSALASLVNGPLAVGVWETVSASTVCDAQAQTLTREWGKLLVDSRREKPRCYVQPKDQIDCIQAPEDRSETALFLKFHRLPQLHLVSVITTNSRAVVSESWKDFEWDVELKVRAATCPP